MRVGDLKGWPPFPETVHGDDPPGSDGQLVGSSFVPANVRIAAHLELSIHHQGKVFKATYWHASEALLYLLSAALSAHIGSTLGACELIELFPAS